MKKNLKYISLIILAINLLSTSYGQKIEVIADKDSILIGEVIQLSIQYPLANSTTSLEFFEGDSIGNGFEVFEVVSNDTVNGNRSIKLGISSFEPGASSIPPFSVFFGQNQLVSNPISVFVSLVSVDTAQPFKDLKPLMNDPLSAKEKLMLTLKKLLPFWWLVIIILIVIAVLIYFLFRKKKEKVVAKPVVILAPPHIEAIKNLQNLDKMQLWQNGNQKQYNVELTEIIQNYISRRFDVPTTERTSNEILDSLKPVQMTEQNRKNLKKLLMLSDLVKFAKQQPTAQENNQVLQEAFEFIETTKTAKESE